MCLFGKFLFEVRKYVMCCGVNVCFLQFRLLSIVNHRKLNKFTLSIYT